MGLEIIQDKTEYSVFFIEVTIRMLGNIIVYSKCMITNKQTTRDSPPPHGLFFEMFKT